MRTLFIKGKKVIRTYLAMCKKVIILLWKYELNDYSHLCKVEFNFPHHTQDWLMSDLLNNEIT